MSRLKVSLRCWPSLLSRPSAASKKKYWAISNQQLHLGSLHRTYQRFSVGWLPDIVDPFFQMNSNIGWYVKLNWPNALPRQKPHGELITAVLLDVDEGLEKVRAGPNDAYILDITLLHVTEPDYDAAELAANTAKSAIQGAFEKKLFDKQSGKWRSIELRYIDAVSEEALTYCQFTLMKPWRLEYISLGADPQQLIVAE